MLQTPLLHLWTTKPKIWSWWKRTITLSFWPIRRSRLCHSNSHLKEKILIIKRLFILYDIKTTTKIPWNKVCQPEPSIGRARESVQSPALFRFEQQLTHGSRPLSEGKKSSRSEYFWQVGRLGYLSMQRAFSSSSAWRSIWYFQSSISLKVLYLQSSKSLRLQSVQCVICKQFGVLKLIGGFRSYLAQNFYFPLLNRRTR